MFSFKKVEIKEILKVAPDDPYQKVLVIGEVGELTEDDDIEEFYFLIEDTTIERNNEERFFSGYMKAYFPAKVIENMYLYMAITDIKDHEMYFIEPQVYETIEEEQLVELLMEVIEYEEEIEEVDVLESLYLNEDEFYELTGISQEVFGHQYVTKDLIFEFADTEEEFYEHMEFEYHKEPLMYRINDTQMLFVGNESLNFLEIPLLELNANGDLMEITHFHSEDALKYFEEENYSVRELMTVFNAIKEIEKISTVIL